MNNAVSKSGKPYSVLTRRGGITSIRKIVQFAYGLDWNSEKFPDSVSWLKKPKDDNGRVNAGDIIRPDEFSRILEFCTNLRDRVWLVLSYSTGWRPDEIMGIKLGDVRVATEGFYFTVKGYKRKQPIELLASGSVVPVMQAWLSVHPDKGNRAAPLWARLKLGEDGKVKAVGSAYFAIRFKMWCEKAGLGRRSWVYLLRHSAATLNPYGLQGEAKNLYFGWTRGSAMPGYYSHLCATDVNHAVAASTGHAPAAEASPLARVRVCPRCAFENIYDAETCQRCAQPLTMEAMKQQQDEAMFAIHRSLAAEIHKQVLAALKGGEATGL
jgi:integrase